MKTQEMLQREERLVSKNRKARYEYEILQAFEAGIALQGTEVKSIRQGKCSIQEAYAAFPSAESMELFLIDFYIKPYDQGFQNHDPKRKRKLLLNARELKKLKTGTAEKGFTIVPLKLYFSGHLVKVEIGLARAKKKYDKRESKKKQDTEREIRKKFRI